LEEYIGKLNQIKIKRQLFWRTIADSNDTLEGFEDLFLTDLFIFSGQVARKNIKDDPKYILSTLKFKKNSINELTRPELKLIIVH
jgi:hypothetical protein